MHETQQPEFIELREMWMVEWSESQGWFHVGNIDEMIGKNIRAYIDGGDTDYALVGITDNEEEAEKLMQLLKSKRKAPLPDPLDDFLAMQNADVEIVSATAPPPANKYKLNPLATAARKNSLKRIPLGDGREIISLKRR